MYRNVDRFNLDSKKQLLRAQSEEERDHKLWNIHYRDGDFVFEANVTQHGAIETNLMVVKHRKATIKKKKLASHNS